MYMDGGAGRTGCEYNDDDFSTTMNNMCLSLHVNLNCNMIHAWDSILWTDTKIYYQDLKSITKVPVA